MKGFNYIIEALHILNDKRVYLDILGEGNMQNELVELVEKYRLNSYVAFRGHVENVEFYLKKADCFIFGSFSESFGNVLLEAMSAELPLITSSFGPLPEINLHEITGLVVKTKNSAAIAQAISQLIENPEMCLKMGRAGRNRVKANFDENKTFQETLNLYQGLLIK